MQIIQSKYDLKVVPADTIVNGFFVIKNVGNSTIMYKEVFTECRCTNLNIEKGDSIMAGKQDTIYFELNTEGMESGESIKKTIRIVTNTTPELHRFFIFGKIK
ncbi:MAG: DUF1573 domain-containing protein [Bacteroidales bacterium]|nr:DUF1573 domain-containing protein [Bacteroidales bacterium]